jgi:hypothetical protein
MGASKLFFNSVFEPYHIMFQGFKGEMKQLPSQCFYKEMENTEK